MAFKMDAQYMDLSLVAEVFGGKASMNAYWEEKGLVIGEDGLLTCDPPGITFKHISAGSYYVVGLLPNGYLCKVPWPRGNLKDRALACLKRESDIYQRIGPHDRLVKFFPTSSEYSIELEYLPHQDYSLFVSYNGYGDVVRDLGREAEHLERTGIESEFYKTDYGIAITNDVKYQWLLDAAEGVVLLHSNDYVHGGLSHIAFLVDNDIRLRIAEFDNTVPFGMAPPGYEPPSYFLPRDPDSPSTVTTDLFALGSVFYSIVTAKPPHDMLSEESIEECFYYGEFPSTDGLLAGDIMQKCWRQEYTSAEDILEALRSIDMEHWKDVNMQEAILTSHAASYMLGELADSLSDSAENSDAESEQVVADPDDGCG